MHRPLPRLCVCVCACLGGAIRSRNQTKEGRIRRQQCTRILFARLRCAAEVWCKVAFALACAGTKRQQVELTLLV